MPKAGVKPERKKIAGAGAGENNAPEEFGQECGGKGGVPFEVFAHANERITRVTVWHRDFIDGIELETAKGTLPRIGGTGKSRDIRRDTFALETDEFLTGISIEFWNYVDRISFHTNKRSYGPYGGMAGQVKKTLYAPEGRRIVGFKGHHWEFVDSLQLIVA